MSKAKIMHQQQKVIARIVEMGPPDEWKEEHITELWTEVVEWGAKKIPKEMQGLSFQEQVGVICMCPYVSEFLKKSEWDPQARFLAKINAKNAELVAERGAKEAADKEAGKQAEKEENTGDVTMGEERIEEIN